MRILQLGKFYPVRGGVEKVMWDLSRGLSARGIHCDMLCAALSSDMPSGGAVTFNEYGRCICVRALSKRFATMLSPAMIFWLRRHCAEYDIIHIHHPDPMACVALRLSGYKGKVVVHWHSDILKQKMLLVLYKPLQKWMLSRADVVVGTTGQYVDGSRCLDDVRGKLTWFPIGIEDNMRMVSAPGVKDTVHTVLGVGRLVSYKGFEHLVSAARYLPDNYRIVIVGTGPEEERLKAAATALEGACPVEFTGYMPDERLKETFNACDVFVLPSTMKTEAFGIVQLEAFCCGKPVVATKIPGSGTSWVNEDGVSGINVPVADPKAIADAVKTICEDRAGYALFCRNARERYERFFTLDEMVDNAVRLYESLQ